MTRRGEISTRAHAFPRASRYKRRSDITEGDIIVQVLILNGNAPSCYGGGSSTSSPRAV